MSDQINWCPNGCDELPASGVCRQCGYDGPGVLEHETRMVVGCDGHGHWYLRPRLRPIYVDDQRAVAETEVWR